jgi:hypothetical protein
MLITSANLIAAMLLTAFVTERAIAAAAFVVDLIRADTGPAKDALLGTLWRTAFAGVIAATVLYELPWMRLLATFDIHDYPYPDDVLTWLVLVSGTDRLSTFIGSGADDASNGKKPAVLELNGTLAADRASLNAIGERTDK